MDSSQPPPPSGRDGSFLTPPSPPDPSAEPAARRRLLPREALAAIQDELRLLPARKIKKLNGDARHIYAIASNGAEHVEALLPEIRHHTPHFPVEPVLKIELYAAALIYAQALCKYGSGSRKLLDEAMQLRRDLLVAAKSAVHAKLISASRFAKLDRGIGYINVGADLLMLASVFDDAWQKVGAATALERERVSRAAELGLILAELAAKRERDPVAVDQRDRTFTLLDAAYWSATRVVTYLRWEQGDMKKLLPGLSTRIGAGRPKLKREPKKPLRRGRKPKRDPGGTPPEQS